MHNYLDLHYKFSNYSGRHRGTEAQRGRGAKGQRHKEKMKTYRDLLVWQKSMTLVAEIYKISKEFPKFVPLCLCAYYLSSYIINL